MSCKWQALMACGKRKRKRIMEKKNISKKIEGINRV
jgi:hypothetical protein